jgi:hypothetical protein
VLLGTIHTQPQTVVPVLEDVLRKTSKNSVALRAAEALGQYGSAAKDAAPSVILLWRSTTKTNEQTFIAEAIKKIDPEAAAKEGIK